MGHDQVARSWMKRHTLHQIEDPSGHLVRRILELKKEMRAELAQPGLRHLGGPAGKVSDAAGGAVASMLVDIDAAIIDRHVRELRGILVIDGFRPC